MILDQVKRARIVIKSCGPIYRLPPHCCMHLSRSPYILPIHWPHEIHRSFHNSKNQESIATTTYLAGNRTTLPRALKCVQVCCARPPVAVCNPSGSGQKDNGGKGAVVYFPRDRHCFYFCWWYFLHARNAVGNTGQGEWRKLYHPVPLILAAAR